MDKEQLYDRSHNIIRAIWCKDSETSEECLVDLYESKIIAVRRNGKIVDPEVLNETIKKETK